MSGMKTKNLSSSEDKKARKARKLDIAAQKKRAFRLGISSRIMIATGLSHLRDNSHAIH